MAQLPEAIANIAAQQSAVLAELHSPGRAALKHVDSVNDKSRPVIDPGAWCAWGRAGRVAGS
jgi:hypothetical protein